MKRVVEKNRKREARHRRIRTQVHGTAECPRLAFFRSNKQVYAQVIDDDKRETIVGVSSLKNKENGSVAKAISLGKDIAAKAKAKGVTKVVFDRGGFMYTGSVKAFADTAREGGLQF